MGTGLHCVQNQLRLCRHQRAIPVRQFDHGAEIGHISIAALCGALPVRVADGQDLKAEIGLWFDEIGAIAEGAGDLGLMMMRDKT